jgi:type IV secretory pathway VirB10-like protein
MSDQPEEEALPLSPPKLDPESFALRARPAKPIRFKRGVIVGLAAAASLGVVATAWVALKPTTFRIVGQADDYPLAAKAPSDTLAVLPTSYGNVPKLGPPLPGDLGRPILDQQRMAPPANVADAGQTKRQVAIADRDRSVDEIKAARESAILFQSADRAPRGAEILSVGDQPRPAATAVGVAPTMDADRDPNAQVHKTKFLAASDKGNDQNPYSVTPLVSPYVLSAGSVISGSLITGLRSDLPGLVTAQVTERVFDSATGRIELIPQGARLIGAYDSVVAFGQHRALVVWQRIIMPDGSSLKIDNVAATDAAGYAGLADKVDFHTWTLLKGVAISTLLGVGSTLGFTGGSDLVSALRQAAQQNVARAGDQLTSRNLQVQPTITIRPGTPVRLVVHRDLVLAPWLENKQ